MPPIGMPGASSAGGEASGGCRVAGDPVVAVTVALGVAAVVVGVGAEVAEGPDEAEPSCGGAGRLGLSDGRSVGVAGSPSWSGRARVQPGRMKSGSVRRPPSGCGVFLLRRNRFGHSRPSPRCSSAIDQRLSPRATVTVSAWPAGCWWLLVSGSRTVQPGRSSPGEVMTAPPGWRRPSLRCQISGQRWPSPRKCSARSQ